MSRLPSNDFMWNLPCTYWPCDAEQPADVREWIKELQGTPVQSPRKSTSQLWDRMQIVLRYLKAGKTYEEAQRVNIRFWNYDGKMKF
jgi:hypothetical protein